jgi:hypothetical protein
MGGFNSAWVQFGHVEIRAHRVARGRDEGRRLGSLLPFRFRPLQILI